jgi:predicted S18 family serine protease
LATVEIGSRASAHGKMQEVVRNGPALMQDAKRNAVAAASECLGRPVQARIDSGRVLGASGGLLFALAVVDELTPGDLTGGRDVTGTGAISATGRVGPVLEIEKKVKRAESEGAELFLVPYEQLSAAKKAARSMSVAGVHDLSEALTVLTGAGCNAHAPRA